MTVIMKNQDTGSPAKQLAEKALKKRKELRAKAEEAVECLRTDLNVMRNGTWLPDEDSCEELLKVVDRIKKYMNSTK